MKRRGQTALEYLLVMVMSVFIVTGVLYFVLDTQKRVGEAADGYVDSILEIATQTRVSPTMTFGAPKNRAPEPTLQPAPAETTNTPLQPAPAEPINTPEPAPAPEPEPVGPVCGNGLRESGEACDSFDLGGQTCSKLGFSGGILRCNPNCSGFDTRACNQAGSIVIF